MKQIFMAVLLLASANLINAQSKTLKSVITLKMSRTVADEMPGTRGACVAWHPVQKKYYASMAGNQDYPLCIFDEKGKRISIDEQNAWQDVRGLWYNPAKKSIQGNCFGEGGWFEYKMDARGKVTSADSLFTGLHQPNDQCVGVYHPVLKQVMFLDMGAILFYDAMGKATDSYVNIQWGRRKNDPEKESIGMSTPDEYNYTSFVYTGIKGSELGFLNAELKQIELYDIKDGFMTSVLKLPENATAEKSFNFAYSNNTYWLFDMEIRTWIGYQ